MNSRAQELDLARFERTISPIQMNRAALFYFLLGAPNPLYGAQVLTELPACYPTVCAAQNLEAAITHAPPFRLVHAERLLAVAKCFRRSYIGQGRRARTENLVSQANWKSAPTQGELLQGRLKVVRDAPRRLTRPDAVRFASLVKIFLPGRPCSFSFEEFVAWVRS